MGHPFAICPVNDSLINFTCEKPGCVICGRPLVIRIDRNWKNWATRRSRYPVPSAVFAKLDLWLQRISALDESTSVPLGVSDIAAFVRHHAPRHGRGWAAQMVTGLRSFFRFPASGNHKVGPCRTGPGCTELGNVWAAQASSDRSSPARADCWRAISDKGKACLRHIACVGTTRAACGEIVVLQLDDINWANAELVVRSKKGDGWAKFTFAG